jgi:hypothetical protein
LIFQRKPKALDSGLHRNDGIVSSPGHPYLSAYGAQLRAPRGASRISIFYAIFHAARLTREASKIVIFKAAAYYLRSGL